MTRFLFALMALGLLGATPQSSAACRRFGTQLECDLGGSQLLLGTQTVTEPAYPGALRPQPLQGSDELFDHDAVPGSPLRLDLQNVGMDPASCRRIGNETYCY